MKKSDIFTVVIIAAVATVAAYFVTNWLLGNPRDASFEFKTIKEITATLADPDPEVFNEDAINPTVEVYIGECEDIDQNGIIDKAELEECRKKNKSGNDDSDDGDDEGEDEDENEDEVFDEEE